MTNPTNTGGAADPVPAHELRNHGSNPTHPATKAGTGEAGRVPWAFIAHKNGRWGGVTVADEDAGKFLARFIKKGYAVTTVYSREEYKAELAKLDIESESRKQGA